MIASLRPSAERILNDISEYVSFFSCVYVQSDLRGGDGLTLIFAFMHRRNPVLAIQRIGALGTTCTVRPVMICVTKKLV